MRSLVLISLLGSFIASTNLVGQSLTEHAAAAAGATIGTAAGKPLGGALGKVFGEVDKSPSNVAPKNTKPMAAKPAPAVPAQSAEHPAAAGAPGGGGGNVAAGGGGGGEAAAGGGGDSAKTARSRHASRRAQLPVAPPAAPSAPITPEPVAPQIKEPSAQDVAGIRLGTTSSELRQALGTAESTVSIPGEDGHLLEIREYWANGEPVGTVRMDNGHVVSVRPNN